MKIYNTLSSSLEEFKPLHSNQVNMYVCGPTVYNNIHIGNARPLIFFDTVRRYFEYKGFTVKFVQNFTDIDDKLIDKAKQENTTVKAIAEKYTKAFFDDTQALNIKDGIIRPKATEHIKQMQSLVENLLAKNKAYVVDGDVYFDIKSFADYGKLSHRNIDDLLAGARVDVNEKKKNPLDFVLWKKAKPDEPKWDSPWGEGRPGWHLECSAMSVKYLGQPFDIHGGGNDLIFPHHENEIAQSEAGSDKDFCRYWMHVGMLNIRGEKMSKSTGNFFYLKDVMQKYSGAQLRMFMLSSHYKKPIDFSEDEMLMAKSKLERLENTLLRIQEQNKSILIEQTDENALTALKAKIKDTSAKFEAAMGDDFNTALAIGAVFELVKDINIFIDNNLKAKNSCQVLNEAQEVITTIITAVMGIELNLGKNAAGDLSAELIELLLKIRWEAKQDKNWHLADQIRISLEEMGIVLKDAKDKTYWSINH